MTIGNTTSLRRLAGVVGALVMAAGSTGALAQTKSEKPLKGSFSRPLNADQDVQQNSTSTTMMSESDGQHTYSVKLENGKVVSAEVDGEQVSKDRVRSRNGKVDILDGDGNVLKTFNVPATGGFGAGGRGMLRLQTIPGGGGGAVTVRPFAQSGPRGFVADEVAPPVMMGITMTDSDQGGVQVASVLDGLPADKAGLQVGDRIISADGKDLAGQQDLRELLKNKKPGDKLDLKVDRDGETKSLTVKLDKFDSDKLQLPQTWVQQERTDPLQAARDAIQKSLDELKANENLKPEKLRAMSQKALQEAMDALDKAKDEMSMNMDELHKEFQGQLGGGNWHRFFGDGGNAFVVPTPVAPPAPVAAPDSDMSRQLEKLSAQIERLNKRLDQLEKDKK